MLTTRRILGVVIGHGWVYGPQALTATADVESRAWEARNRTRKSSNNAKLTLGPAAMIREAQAMFYLQIGRYSRYGRTNCATS